jgi:hypothetical protein
LARVLFFAIVALHGTTTFLVTFHYRACGTAATPVEIGH